MTAQRHRRADDDRRADSLGDRADVYVSVMKLYRVVREVEGRTIKEPGVTQTELRQETLYYCAESMQSVWDEIAWIRSDVEARLVAIIEDAQSVTVMTAQRPSAEGEG